MLELIAQYQAEINQFQSVKPEEIEQFRIKFLGTKGLLKALFDDFKNVPAEQKKEVGQRLNELKTQFSISKNLT